MISPVFGHFGGLFFADLAVFARFSIFKKRKERVRGRFLNHFESIWLLEDFTRARIVGFRTLYSDLCDSQICKRYSDKNRTI